MSTENDSVSEHDGLINHDGDYKDGEYYYANVRVTAYEEIRTQQGELGAVKLELTADLFEAKDDGDPIPVSDCEKFRARAPTTERHNELRITEFAPVREHEYDGIRYSEFPMFWEVVGALDERGFRVDTGCMAYRPKEESR